MRTRLLGRIELAGGGCGVSRLRRRQAPGGQFCTTRQAADGRFIWALVLWQFLLLGVGRRAEFVLGYEAIVWYLVKGLV